MTKHESSPTPNMESGKQWLTEDEVDRILLEDAAMGMIWSEQELKKLFSMVKEESLPSDSSPVPVEPPLMPGEKICPYCAETIKAAAVVCRYCGKHLRETEEPTSSTSNAGRILSLLASTALILSTFLPWAYVTSITDDSPLGIGRITIYGYETAGIFAVLIGVLLLVIAAVKKPKVNKRYSYWITIVGATVVVLVIIYISLTQLQKLQVPDEYIPSDGPGPYVAFLGGLLAIVGGLLKGGKGVSKGQLKSSDVKSDEPSLVVKTVSILLVTMGAIIQCLIMLRLLDLLLDFG